ncbi:acyl-CoA dehydrogenase family protein [Pseudomonas citronellolis]|uniref:acyl-CoA dehydrogenase family protein n=1 Tax=Pseudomonas citronellolis TaxID=53408 RepID=UPI0023E46ED1|nr:acyl-CoA dehydrogenase family protein [Pseudomonas citronellolis]MDF3935955.1 acyl-CoA dehydrogenase family protein [Pseudomonas citronellolis]
MSRSAAAAQDSPLASRAALFEQVLDEVRQRRDEFDARSHVPRDMIERFIEVGIYRAATPRCFGGDALPPAEFLRLIERISEADGSAGWVASFGSASTYLTALPRETLAELYADGPDLVFAGGLFPIQQAEQVEGGWRVSGTWKFASGCKGADVLGVGIGLGGPGGKPRTALLRARDVDIVDNWEVVGLKGTGSHDLHLDKAFVPDAWTFIRGGQSSIDEPLYRYPTIAYAAQVLAVVNLGLARAALDEIARMASGSGVTGAPKLADRAYVRIELGKAEAQLHAARGFFYDATEQVWESILAGNPVTPEQVSLLRLSAVHVSRAGAEVVQRAYSLAGTTAIYLRHPLQRYLRDAMVVTQHAFLSDGMYDGAGAVLLDVPPFPGYL